MNVDNASPSTNNLALNISFRNVKNVTELVDSIRRGVRNTKRKLFVLNVEENQGDIIQGVQSTISQFVMNVVQLMENIKKLVRSIVRLFALNVEGRTENIAIPVRNFPRNRALNASLLAAIRAPALDTNRKHLVLNVVQ